MNKDYLLSIKGSDRDKSKRFCILPWIHANIMPDSTVIPCCVAPYDDHFGNLNNKTLKEVWNDEKFSELRLNMLSEKSSPTCQRCYTLEESGIDSMRNSMNYRFGKFFDDIVPLTNEKGELPRLNIKYFDVRFSNMCNFKCRGCSPVLSSSWYDDHQSIYNYQSDLPKIISCTDEGSNDTWKQLEEIIPYIYEAYFAGGEPLMMEEHYLTLQKLLESNRSDAVLSYNTNLSVLRYKKYDLISMWRNFQHLYISISLDDIKERGEYFRHGLNWNKFLMNLDTLKKEIPHAKLSLTITVSAFNANYLPEIYYFFVSNKIIDPWAFTFNLLLDPEEYTLQILPIGIKEKIKNKLQNSYSKFQATLPEASHDHYFSQIHSIIEFMMTEDHTERIPEFKKRTQALDRLRSEDFSTVYPELASLIR